MTTIRQAITLDSTDVIQYVAKDVRNTPTGIHADVSIWVNTALLAGDQFNVGRHKERVTLANAAHARLGKATQQLWSKDAMLDHLTSFSAKLWENWLSSLRACDLTGDLDKPLEFWCNPYIIKGGGTILFAPKGAGKTYFGLLIARCIDQGISYFFPVTKCKVLFVQLERSAETFGRRIAQVNRALGLPEDLPMFTLIARGKSLTDIIDVVKRHVDEDGVELVIVDSISRSGAGDMGKDSPANAIMDALNGAAPSWLALAHTSHEGVDNPEKAHIYGSVMFGNAADVVVQQVAQRKPNSLGIVTRVVDANDIQVGHTDVLAFDFDARGLKGIRKTEIQEFPELNATKREGRVEAVIRVIDGMGRATTSQVSEGTGLPIATVSRILSGGEFVKLGREGKEVYYGVKTNVSTENVR